jgi:hypothetical protein
MKNFEFPDRKNSRRKQLETKKTRNKKEPSDESFGQHKLKKEFKHKKDELRADELWEDWENDE